MSIVESILNEIDKLDINEESYLYHILEERRAVSGYVSDVTIEVRENRFEKGKVCPHCNGESVSRYGKYKDKQRY